MPGLNPRYVDFERHFVLGANVAEIFRVLDCATISTDFAGQNRLPGILLQDMLSFSETISGRPLTQARAACCQTSHSAEGVQTPP